MAEDAAGVASAFLASVAGVAIFDSPAAFARSTVQTFTYTALVFCEADWIFVSTETPIHAVTARTKRVISLRAGDAM